MNKAEFVLGLYEKLPFLPLEEAEERIGFYVEMIDDRMEEGLSEEEAVEQIGSVDAIAAQIIADIPLTKIAKERIKPNRRLKAGEIVLLALGSPIWLSLGIAAFAVVLSLYVSLWSVIISLWSVFVSFAACAVGGVAAGAVLAIVRNGPAGVVIFAAGIVCAGLSIFAFYGCKAVTKGILLLTKRIAVWTKNCFLKKEEAQCVR